MGSQIQLSDFVGDHGPYQLLLTAILFLRYVLLGLMASSGPLMTPDVTFYCQLPMEEILAIMPNISTLNKSEQTLEIREETKRICQLDLHLYQQTYLASLNASASKEAKQLKLSANASSHIRECSDFSYELAPDQGRTMTSEFDLVCERAWLRSLFQSCLSAAIVVAHVFWGTFSDKYGRFRAQKICLLVSLFSGLWSIFARDFWSFVLSRAFCSFGDLGLVVSLTTTLVELVGNRFRGLSVALVNFGYALGVSVLPYIVAYFEDFRLVLIFTLLCHLLSVPLILCTNESIRWLLTNRRFESAKKELKRIATWNGNSIVTPLIEPSGRKLINSQKSSSSNQSSGQDDHFELLFQSFIEQIESQNAFDPLQEPSQPEVTITVQLDEQQQQQQQHRPDSKLSLATDQDLARISVSACQLSKEKSAEPRVECALHQVANRLAQPSWQLRARAGSCGQLGLILDSGANRLRADDKLRKLSASSLTLPAIFVQDHYGQVDFVGRRRQQADCMNLVGRQLSFVGRVSRLFNDKQLMIAVFTIVWTTFNSELLYTSFIIINLEVGEDVYLNYVLGGCMEALAAITASLLLSYAPRRHSLIAFWLLISVFCFGLSAAHIDSTWAVWLLALAKFSQSSLSSIASVSAYESFPTFLRQSGSGLVFTLGMLGSVVAPLIFAEFDDQVGMDRVLMTFALSSLLAAILIHRYLRETKNCELQ